MGILDLNNLSGIIFYGRLIEVLVGGQFPKQRWHTRGLGTYNSDRAELEFWEEALDLDTRALQSKS